MKVDNATRLLNDLQQLIHRWALEIDAKPLWWRGYSATASGGTAGPLTMEGAKKVAKEVKFQRPISRKDATGRKTSPNRRDRGDAKNGPVSRAGSPAVTRP